ncbi:MAG: signal transduction histidine kinase [Planctomycetota bacterium]|jgi:signal transduction histidine kinase
MFFYPSAAAERAVPLDARGRTLQVCAGAAVALMIAVFMLRASIGGVPTFLAIGALLASAGAVAHWARSQVVASEARLSAVVAQTEDLDRANAELRRFAQVVAHDLRAPLISTSGYLEMAKENARSGEVKDVMQLLDRATDTAQRMDDLISGLLGLATGDTAVTATPVSIDSVVQNALDDLSPELKRRGFEIQREQPLGLALGDARYIQQAFDNVLGNALKYCRPGRPNEAPIIEIRAVREHDRLRISVADNGPGIAPEDWDSLLSPQQGRLRASRRPSAERPLTGGNAGLGLGLAQKAVQGCGGDFSIQASAMGGAEFVLEFRAEPCALHILSPAALPAALPRELIADHMSSSSRMMLTTG